MTPRAKTIFIAALLCVAAGIAIIAAAATYRDYQVLQQHNALARAGGGHPIGAWMTIPAIARAYHLPQSYLYQWLHTQGVTQYAYLALWFVIFIAAVGAPLPITLALLAAGALSALGNFNLFILALVAVSASVCGDNLGYFIGRRWGIRLLDWLERAPRRFLFSPRVIARGRTYFARRGGWAIFLTRFLLSGLGGVINLLAGSNPYPYRRFLLADISGKTLGAAILLGLGYIFGASWEAAGALFGDASLLFLAGLAIVMLSVSLIRIARRAKARAAEGVPHEHPATHRAGKAHSQPPV